MMKTLCVAVVVLSLTSVCQPASLACDKLLKPVDERPALTGSWYLVAMASDACMVTSLLNALLSLSVRMDISSKQAPHTYDANYEVKIYGYCANESETFFSESNTMFDIDSNGAPTGEADVMLQTGCPDCIIVKDKEAIDILMLFSRRKTVTAEELKEFEAQTKCLGWAMPQVLDSDHDYVNCQPMDEFDEDDIDTSALFSLVFRRLKTAYMEPLQCLAWSLLNDPHSVLEWFQELW